MRTDISPIQAFVRFVRLHRHGHFQGNIGLCRFCPGCLPLKANLAAYRRPKSRSATGAVGPSGPKNVSGRGGSAAAVTICAIPQLTSFMMVVER